VRWPRPQPYVPGDPEPLFTAEVNAVPRAGLVAYHREIDASSLYVPAMLGFRRMTSAKRIEEAQAADIFAYWGGLQGESRKLRLSRWAQRLKRPLLLLEDGLFRSVEIGLSGTPALSIMLDDRGAYYDATATNRLEKLLASRRQFTDEERARARACIQRIGELRLSKYNHAADRPLDYPAGSVLLVDQRRGDLSVTKGLADETSFRDLVISACRENPDRTILVKRHPDAMSGGKQSYFSSESLAEWGSFPNLVLIDYETNPHALFDCCSKVYVVTSGMGFEALMRGLEVHCFGMPFYAGWGLTKDRRTCRRRKRRRTVEEVFFAACILHSRYFDPTRLVPCCLEEAIEALARARDARQQLTNGA
jgi:capsule polysaccharide export protein KpsC/LpsZ